MICMVVIVGSICLLYIPAVPMILSALPKWIQFLCLHPALIKKLDRLGILVSVLGSALTLGLLMQSEDRSPARVSTGGIGRAVLIGVGISVLCSLAVTLPAFFLSFWPSQRLNTGGNLTALLQNLVLLVGSAALWFGVLGFIGITVFVSALELMNRLKRLSIAEQEKEAV